MKAIDISKWSAVTISPDWFQWIKEQGFELIIIGLWHGAERNDKAELWIDYANRVGLKVHGYTALNMRNGSTAVIEAIGAAGVNWRAVERLSLDVELPTITTIIEEARNRAEKEGKKPYIYTRRNIWYYDDSFPQLGLWNASYGVTPSLELPVPYGGWTRAVGHQYAENVLLNGVSVDLNIFDREWVEGDSMAHGPVTIPSELWTLVQKPEFKNHLSIIDGQTSNVEAHTEEILGVAQRLDMLEHGELGDALRAQVEKLRTEASGAHERVIAIDDLFGLNP